MRLIRRSPIAAFALLIIALSSVASADELSGKYLKGDWIAGGTFKNAWTVLDAKTRRPIKGKVLVTVDRTKAWKDLTTAKIASMLEDEAAQLDQLARAGVPTVSFDAIGTYEGRPAAIEPAYAISNRAWMSWNGDQAIWRTDIQPGDRWHLRVLNQKSITSIKKIRKAMEASGLFVRDPQVLIAPDGTVVVADPLEVEGATPNADAYRTRMNSMLDLLQAEAQRRVAARKARLNSAFVEEDVGPDATPEELAQFAADVADAGGVLRRAGRDELPEDVQASTYLGDDGRPTVLLPEEGAPAKKIALVDELEHVRQIARAVEAEGEDAVRRLFQDAARGEVAARARLLDWELAAKRTVLSIFEPDHPAAEAVKRSIDDLEKAPGAGLEGEGLPKDVADAIRRRGETESASPGIAGELRDKLDEHRNNRPAEDAVER
jgi:hypothetical protein